MKIGSSIRPGRHEAAYTLIEVIFAVGLVAIMFVSLYLGISFGFAVTQVERENLRATQIMLERMEGMRLLTYDQVLDTGINPRTFTNTFYPPGISSQSGGVTYFGTVTVITNITLNPPASYSPDMMLVAVQVQWTSGSALRTRRMGTYVARNGLQNYVFHK